MTVESDGASEFLLWEENQQEKSVDIVKQINAKNAKFVACGLVVGFILYHGVVHFRYGTDSCKWLLSGGKYKGDMEWQPYGCMMHQYSQLDTRRCIRALAFLGRHNHFIFIGDTRILEIYAAFLDHLRERQPFEERQPLTLLPNKNHTFSDVQLRVTVDFIWSPFISRVMVESFRKWMEQLEPPSLIVAGCGIEAIQKTNSSLKGVKEYSYNLTKLVLPIDTLTTKKSRVLWMLLEPVNEEKLPKQWSSVSNHAVDQYNWAAREVLYHSKAQIWASTMALVSGLGGWDGHHIPSKALKHHTQILANLHCNDHMAFNDGTCCSSPERTTLIQRLTYSGIAFCCLLGFLVVLRRKKTARLRMEPPSCAYTLIVSLAKLGVIMGYFYLCDRTNFFMKENKYYSPISFWLPLGYVFALGIFFTEDSRFTKVLHRDQTEEWRGWMQLVLLIYNMTGASTNLLIRNHAQIIVSAYFFLSGYCHFYYLWQRQDAGIIRFFQILFRLNFLPVLLCLCMNRPYQFYAFAPLISFWFLLVYLVLVCPPRVSAQSVETNPLHYLYLILKLVGLFSLIIILFMSEVFFEKVFVTRPWKALFVSIDDDIHDWWVRWKLNRYTMCYGVIFGLAVVTAQRYGLIDDSNHSNLMSKRPALAVTFLALIGLAAASGYAFLCPSSLDCDEVHSYSTFVPIISYIVLRNVNGTLRSRYSSLFAWFGKISLELCFCQYHIWMAADSHGVLVFVPGYPVINVLITSFIFVCASHEIHQITYTILPYAVPSDWRKVVRNFFIFLCLLVPMGIDDGMF